MAPKITLTYFNVKARAELARLILAAGGLEFEDKRVEGDTWKALKDETPFGQLPILEWDGEMIGQSMTIARFVAKKAGLAGRNELEEAQADMVVDHVVDLVGKFYPVMFAKTPEDKKKLGDEFFQKQMPNFLSSAEALLKKRGGKHFAGGNLTWADIAVTLMLDNLLNKEYFEGIDGQEVRHEIPNRYPALGELRHSVHEQAGIKKWIAERPVTRL